MTRHCHDHGCHRRRGQQSSSSGYGAPSYNYDPLQQAPYGGQQMAPAYGQQAQGYGRQVMPQQPGGYGGYPGQELQYLQAEEHRHRKNEHRAEMGALGAVAFAAYEKHEEKVDPAHAHRHHVETQAAEAAALGLGGYALYEHHEANKIHKQESHLGGGGRHQGRHHRR